jgi:hypothetical protein
MKQAVTGCLLVAAAVVASYYVDGDMGRAWGQPKRAGKVVRVERARARPAVGLRICPLPYSESSQGTCMGGEPRAGDTGALFDFEGDYLGKIRVTYVVSSQRDDLCAAESAFDFTYELVDMRKAAGAVTFAVAVFGVEVDPAKARLITDSGKLVAPDGNPAAQPWLGMDGDGDDSADIMVTAFECRSEAPLPPVAPGVSVDVLCLEYWRSGAGRWNKVRRDYLYSCS